MRINEIKEAFIIDTDEGSFVLPKDDIYNQSRFMAQCVEQGAGVWTKISNTKFREMIENVLNTDGCVRQISGALHEFVRKDRRQRKHGNDEMIHHGIVLVMPDGRTAWFSLSCFLAFLDSKGWKLPRRRIRKYLRELGAAPIGNTTIGGKQIRPWAVDLMRLGIV